MSKPQIHLEDWSLIDALIPPKRPPVPVPCSAVEPILSEEGIRYPANESFEAINAFVHHSEVSFEELQWALLGIAASRDSAWQPMEAAPQDGTAILLACRESVKIGKWDDDRHSRRPRPFWNHDHHRTSSARADQPTAWLPLPHLPNAPTAQRPL